MKRFLNFKTGHWNIILLIFTEILPEKWIEYCRSSVDTSAEAKNIKRKPLNT